MEDFDLPFAMSVHGRGLCDDRTRASAATTVSARSTITVHLWAFKVRVFALKNICRQRLLSRLTSALTGFWRGQSAAIAERQSAQCPCLPTTE